ncbi:MAG: hypothetical protein IBX67_06195 [Dehalococcoidia bacterium]|nr:hypothetical protein [Dehalococcoidia bacterium]
MRMLSTEELGRLMESVENPAVSIYMPTHRVGDIEQDPIRLKNLLREAEARLGDYGLRTADTRNLLEPAERLLADSHFWQHQGDGLAVFLSPGTFQHYQLPLSFKELAVVAERFHIKPLVPLFSEDGVFYVLAVSQNQVKLLQCTRYHVQDVTPEDVPSSLADALKYDDPEKQHQFHTTGPGGVTISHGHGISKDYDKVNILRYFQQVDRGLQSVLGDEHAPLIIAAVDYLHPLYREASKYRYLLDEGIEGNTDGVSEKNLQQQAWPIVQPFFERGRTEALETYSEALTKGLATNDVKHAALAAYDGRVSTLFVATGAEQWGQFDPQTRKIRLYNQRGPGIEDLLDFAVVHTLAKGGAVYAVAPGQVPGETAIGAILRY